MSKQMHSQWCILFWVLLFIFSFPIKVQYVLSKNDPMVMHSYNNDL